MGRSSEWLTQLPVIVGRLEEDDGQDLYSHEEVAALFQVSRSQAYRLMAQAGAGSNEGGRALVTRAELLAYVQRQGEFEANRRARFAQWLEEQRTRAVRQPPLLIPALADEEERALARADLDHLPDGVELRPGRFVVDFSDGLELLEKLQRFAIVVRRNEQAFYSRMAQRKGAA